MTRDITCAKFAHMGIDADQTYITELYNLDVIISVGYRVKSKRGTQFRIWANSVLKDYTYALDTLDRYDYQNLMIRSTSKEYFRATYENAMDVNLKGCSSTRC